MLRKIGRNRYSPEILAVHVSVREDGRAYVSTYDYRQRRDGLPFTVRRRHVSRATSALLETAVREGLSDLWSTLPTFAPGE